jgi:DNA-3-methyladenine glycosylase I
MDVKRCGWCLGSDLMIAYHDQEWGVPLHDDTKLFEFMVLDAFQAGLSWSTILNKRESFRGAFDGFDPAKIAHYRKRKIDALLRNAGIVRNRQKIEAAINNAGVFLDVQREHGTFDAYIWDLAGGRTRRNRFRTMKQIPASTEQSDLMSKALKKRGFKFVGSTICYAFMQAAGMVNDHVTGCFRHAEIDPLAFDGKSSK